MPNPTPDMPRLPVLLLSLAARHTVVAVALHEIRDRGHPQAELSHLVPAVFSYWSEIIKGRTGRKINENTIVILWGEIQDRHTDSALHHGDSAHGLQ